MRYFIIIFIFQFLSCENGKEENTIRKWYYENGSLQKVQEYVNDTIPHGTYKFYYPNGQLQDSSELIYGKFHGERYEYYDNGQLHIFSNYNNDKFRNAITYKDDGNLDSYKAFGYFNNLMFLVKYDSLKRIKNHEGNAIYNWFIPDTVAVGEKFDIEFLVADPPFCTSNVTIRDLNQANNTAITEAVFKPDKLNRVVVTRKHDLDKNMYISVTVMIEELLGNSFITDTVLIKVDKAGLTSFE